MKESLKYVSVGMVHERHKLRILYTILLTKTTAVQNEVALSYHKVRGLYFLAVVFAATIDGMTSLEKS